MDFLIITTMVVTTSSFSIALNTPESNCSTDGLIISSQYSQICCNGEIYTTKRYRNFQDSCNVEPKDKDLSYEDSMWLAYSCNLKKWLENEHLDYGLKSVVTFMSQLLPEERQADLWSKKLSSEVSVQGSTEKVEVTMLKHYLSEYYRGIQEIFWGVKVCLHQNTKDKKSDLDEKTLKRRKSSLALLNPTVQCKNGPVPTFSYHNFLGNTMRKIVSDTDRTGCKSKLEAEVKSANSKQIKSNATSFCFLILHENFDMQKLEMTDIDFEEILLNFFPKFWSKSTKAIAKDAVFKILKRDFSSNAADFKELIPELTESFKMNVKNAIPQGKILNKEDKWVNAFLIQYIYNISGYVRYYVMCQRGGIPF